MQPFWSSTGCCSTRFTATEGNRPGTGLNHHLPPQPARIIPFELCRGKGPSGTIGSRASPCPRRGRVWAPPTAGRSLPREGVSGAGGPVRHPFCSSNPSAGEKTQPVSTPLELWWKPAARTWSGSAGHVLNHHSGYPGRVSERQTGARKRSRFPVGPDVAGSEMRYPLRRGRLSRPRAWTADAVVTLGPPSWPRVPAHCDSRVFALADAGGRHSAVAVNRNGKWLVVHVA